MESIFTTSLTSFLLATSALVSSDGEKLSDRQLSIIKEPAICQSLDPITMEWLCGPKGLLGPAFLGLQVNSETRLPPLSTLEVHIGTRAPNQSLFLHYYLKAAAETPSDQNAEALSNAWQKAGYAASFFKQAAVWVGGAEVYWGASKSKLNGYPEFKEECIGLLELMTYGVHPSKIRNSNLNLPAVKILHPEIVSENISEALKEVDSQFPKLDLAGLPYFGNSILSSWFTEEELECEYYVSQERLERFGPENDAGRCPYIGEKVDKSAAVYRLDNWLPSGEDAFLLYLEDDCRNNSRYYYSCASTVTSSRRDVVYSHIAYVGENWQTSKLFFNPGTRLLGKGALPDNDRLLNEDNPYNFGSSLFFQFNSDVYVAQLDIHPETPLSQLNHQDEARRVNRKGAVPEYIGWSQLTLHRYARGSAVSEKLCRFKFVKSSATQNQSR